MPDFKSLDVYYWAATLGSFSRAAERLNMTQPGVSQRIAALEREFGLPLFERNARAVVLDAQGP